MFKIDPPPGLRHGCNRCAHPQEDAGLVDIDHPPVAVESHVGQWGGLRDAGIVHENIEFSEGVYRGRDGGSPILLASDIEVVMESTGADFFGESLGISASRTSQIATLAPSAMRKVEPRLRPCHVLRR